MIFDFGFGQRRLLDGRPHHRAIAAIEQAIARELVQLARDHRFGAIIHRGVGLVPLADDAQPLELFALHADPVIGEFAAIFPKLIDRNGVLGLPVLAITLLDLPFDRKTVTVPAGDIRRILAEHRLRAADEVLEDLVQPRADVQVAIRVRRAVVKDEERPALRLRADAAIEIHLLPAREPVRLGSGQTGFHRKVGGRKKESRLVIAGGLCVGRVGHCLRSLSECRSGLPSRSSRQLARLRLSGFDAAAFAGFASEGWRSRAANSKSPKTHAVHRSKAQGNQLELF